MQSMQLNKIFNNMLNLELLNFQLLDNLIKYFNIFIVYFVVLI
jgi:hypothetical protein